jgi:hypothetical protein
MHIGFISFPAAIFFSMECGRNADSALNLLPSFYEYQAIVKKNKTNKLDYSN